MKADTVDPDFGSRQCRGNPQLGNCLSGAEFGIRFEWYFRTMHQERCCAPINPPLVQHLFIVPARRRCTPIVSMSSRWAEELVLSIPDIPDAYPHPLTGALTETYVCTILQ